LDLYHPSQLRSQARSRKRELYAMKQGLEAHDLQSWEDVTSYSLVLLTKSLCLIIRLNYAQSDFLALNRFPEKNERTSAR
ncbi:MAG: hypothetical protein ABSB56_06240, partial [Nitrososphaerales archaeon]